MSCSTHLTIVKTPMFEAVLEDEQDHGDEGFEPAYIDRVLDFQAAHPKFSLDKSDTASPG